MEQCVVVNDVCRLCVTNSDTLVNVFSAESLQLQIKDKLDALFPFSILEEDTTTTTTICATCYAIVDNFYGFYVRVLENQSHFNTCTTMHALDVIDFLANDSISTGRDKSVSQCETLVSIETPPKDIEKTLGRKPPSPQCTDIDIEEVVNDEYTNLDEIDSHMRPKPCQSEARETLTMNPTEVNHHLLDDSSLDHLKVRQTKASNDAQIKEFVKLACDLCSTNTNAYRSFKELLEHFRIAHDQPGYLVCCERKFYRKDRLMNHITNHINPDAFKCPQCGQICKSKILLRFHMKQHLPAEHRKYQCSKCAQRFVLKSQLTNHEASHFSADQKKFVCDVCDKAFALKFVMVKHMLTHSPKKNFVCDVCAKSFSSASNLQTHIAHHQAGALPRVQCPICSLWYKNADTLSTHLHRHRDQRRHICDTCHKECTTRSSLAAHIRYVHRKISQYECTICQKQFRRRIELTEHKARHTGETLYQCPFCPKTFASNSNFFAHRKNSHPAQFALIDKDAKLKSSGQS